MKRSLIIANWKMYLTSLAEANILATSVRNNVGNLDHAEVILCPPSIWLTEIASIVGKGKVKLACQNISYEENGPFTGEISPKMLKGIAEYVLVGHSERREYFGETDFDVSEKVAAALKNNITPIICVGEKEKGEKISQPQKELEEALSNLSDKDKKRVIIAYEPLWAITSSSKQQNAEPEYVAKVITKLRELVYRDTPILYGGSVKPENVEGYAKRPEIDGVLVGSASAKGVDFINICKIWTQTKNFK